VVDVVVGGPGPPTGGVVDVVDVVDVDVDVVEVVVVASS